ncbi:MAG: cytochrome P450 [Pirellulaceae bacterium]|jgi:cytochrome P450|nr:cytochrome P450 [Pirellulaceae bacterium]HJN13449.1 cytochrome P450 [Pirellulaceae bacterium]
MPFASALAAKQVQAEVLNIFFAGYETTSLALTWALYLRTQHPSYWDAPDAFRPERFVSTKQPASHPFAYVPFGASQRICLGEHFAMTEAILLLAMLCSHFRFGRVDDGPVIPVGMGTLYPKDPLRLRLYRR